MVFIIHIFETIQRTEILKTQNYPKGEIVRKHVKILSLYSKWYTNYKTDRSGFKSHLEYNENYGVGLSVYLPYGTQESLKTFVCFCYVVVKMFVRTWKIEFGISTLIY